MSEQNSFDCVVIGSGLGGLTAGALLAKAGRSVCVLERNHSLGGAASSFKAGSLMIEASLHQTADPRDPRDPKHVILSELGLLNELDWLPVSPFFTVEGGPLDRPFDLPHGFGAARDALQERFPAERRAIGHVLDAIERLHGGIADLTGARAERSPAKLMRGAMALRSAVASWRASLDDVLIKQFGGNEALKFALAGNLNYYADDPSKLWWLFFAIAQGGFLASGGAYIKGGSRTLSMKLAKLVTGAGGRVLLGRRVSGIDLDADGKCVAVRHVDHKTGLDPVRVKVRTALANCAPSLLADMIGGPAGEKFGLAYAGRALSISLFSAHFGLKEPASRFGLGGYSTIQLPSWMTKFDDLAKSWALLGHEPGSDLPALGIANYGAIKAEFAGDGPALLSVVGADRLSNWAGLSPEAEKQRRAHWLDAILSALDRRYPGLGGAVVEKMFLNARSMQNYLGTPDGAIYGFAPEPPQRSILRGVPRSARTPVPGLFLASSFAGSGGFTGAMLAGAQAAGLTAAWLDAGEILKGVSSAGLMSTVGL